MAPPPARPFADELGAKAEPLRIAFAGTAPDGTALDPDCAAALQDAARLCGELGHAVEEARPELDQAAIGAAFLTLWRAGVVWQFEAWARRTGKGPAAELVEPMTWALYQHGRSVSGADYLDAVQTLQSNARRMARFLEGYDLWLTPTLAAPPPPLGHFDPAPGNPLMGLARVAAFIPFTPLANGFGLPAMSVPLYWTEKGLPIGSHFLARFGDEAVLFRLAAELEAARPWAARRPPIAA